MPKEFTHFLIADAALAKAATENVGAARCLRENYRLFMLGAILCDSAYYHIPFSGGKDKLTTLSENIHTPYGEIDSAFFQRLAEMVAKENKEVCFAFLCGILSHHLADRNFHPFIFYFTGEYSNPSRHRFMESLIDIRLMDVMTDKKVRQTPATDYLRLEKTEMLPCLQIFIRAALPQATESETDATAGQLWKALRFEIFLSNLYKNRLFRKTLTKANALLKGRMSPFITLFYPEEGSCDLPLLNSEFSYRDPFSGEKIDACLESIAEETTEQLSSAIMLAYKNLKGSKPLFDENTKSLLFNKINKRDEETLDFQHSDTEAIDAAMRTFLRIKN